MDGNCLIRKAGATVQSSNSRSSLEGLEVKKGFSPFENGGGDNLNATDPGLQRKTEIGHTTPTKPPTVTTPKEWRDSKFSKE